MDYVDITQVLADVNSGLASWGKSFHFWLHLAKICVIPVRQLFMFQVVAHRFCVPCLTPHFLLRFGTKMKNLLRLSKDLSHLEQQRNYLPNRSLDKYFFKVIHFFISNVA